MYVPLVTFKIKNWRMLCPRFKKYSTNGPYFRQAYILNDTNIYTYKFSVDFIVHTHLKKVTVTFILKANHSTSGIVQSPTVASFRGQSAAFPIS